MLISSKYLVTSEVTSYSSYFIDKEILEIDCYQLQ